MLLKGQAQIKPKSIKYLGGGGFELILTGVETEDPMDLLSLSGSMVKFQFTSMLREGNEYTEQPEAGRLFDSNGGVVENVRTDSGEPPDEIKCWCSTCSNYKWLNGVICGPDRWEKCTDCGGKCPDGEKCPNYQEAAINNNENMQLTLQEVAATTEDMVPEEKLEPANA